MEYSIIKYIYSVVIWCNYYLCASHALISGSKTYAKDGFVFTIALAVTFTLLQVLEYVEAPFNISDGIYGSTFYMATGFHGFHVLIGTIFIAVCFFRLHHFNSYSSRWFWISGMVLAFCWCSLVIFICFYLLVGAVYNSVLSLGNFVISKRETRNRMFSWVNILEIYVLS